MGKHARYKKHYRKEWEKETPLKGWLTANKKPDAAFNNKEAHCKVCKVDLRAQHFDLIRHGNTPSHKTKAERLRREESGQPSLPSFAETSNASKAVDMRIAVLVAMHSAIRSVDHLTDVMKNLGQGSKLEDVKLHRTKCSRIISAVIAPALLTDLVRDVGDSGFSLIVDESTDLSVTKFLALCIRYYSKKRRY